MMYRRICFGISILLIISLGFGWIALPLTVIGLFIYDTYYETALWGLCIDALYGSHYATIGALILLVLTFYFKKRLVFYS
jgi:hypothetical protein